MSILIKGMEMPDSCFHCKLAEVCKHYKAEHYANKRHEDCPIEEVPSAQPETHEERTETHVCDCISRQAAIDEIKALYEWHDTVTEDRTIDHLKRLPSAQPTQCNSSNVLRHPQCTSRTKLGNCDPVGGFCTSVPKEICDAQVHDVLNDTDIVSRQAAINAIEKNAYRHTYLDQIIDIIKALPSAQLELPDWAQKVEEYRKSAPSFVRNQLTWALYQTWKEYDGRLVHQRGKENRWLNM